MTCPNRLVERIRDVFTSASSNELPERLALMVIDAEERAEAFWLLALAALDELAKREVEVARLREQHHALVDECRHMRESVVQTEAA